MRRVIWTASSTLALFLVIVTTAFGLSVSGQGVSLVAEFEGLPNAGRVYNDPVGYCTQGYGELIRYANCTAADYRRPAYTPAFALTRLRSELNGKYADFVRRCVKVPLNQSQFDATVSAVYNLGGGFVCGDTGFARALARRDYAGAANEFLKWVNAGGRPLPGLVRRRAAERKLFLSKSVIQVLSDKEQRVVDSIAGWRARVARNREGWDAPRNRYALRRITSLKQYACARARKISQLGSQAVEGRKLRIEALEKAAKGCA
jgi:lysozyme